MSICSTGMPPRWGRIPAAVSYSGIGRSKLYQLAAANPGLFRKCGAATIVNFGLLDKILDDLPAAEIGVGTNETAA
jgi:hypothetical protein